MSKRGCLSKSVASRRKETPDQKKIGFCNQRSIFQLEVKEKLRQIAIPVHVREVFQDSESESVVINRRQGVGDKTICDGSDAREKTNLANDCPSSSKISKSKSSIVIKVSPKRGVSKPSIPSIKSNKHNKKRKDLSNILSKQIQSNKSDKTLELKANESRNLASYKRRTRSRDRYIDVERRSSSQIRNSHQRREDNYDWQRSNYQYRRSQTQQNYSVNRRITNLEDSRTTDRSRSRSRNRSRSRSRNLSLRKKYKQRHRSPAEKLSYYYDEKRESDRIAIKYRKSEESHRSSVHHRMSRESRSSNRITNQRRSRSRSYNCPKNSVQRHRSPLEKLPYYRDEKREAARLLRLRKHRRRRSRSYSPRSPRRSPYSSYRDQNTHPPVLLMPIPVPVADPYFLPANLPRFPPITRSFYRAGPPIGNFTSIGNFTPSGFIQSRFRPPRMCFPNWRSNVPPGPRYFRPQINFNEPFPYENHYELYDNHNIND